MAVNKAFPKVILWRTPPNLVSIWKRMPATQKLKVAAVSSYRNVHHHKFFKRASKLIKLIRLVINTCTAKPSMSTESWTSLATVT